MFENKLSINVNLLALTKSVILKYTVNFTIKLYAYAHVRTEFSPRFRS